MKWLIAIFLIVPFVTCQSKDQLDAATLLQQAKNVSCAEFTKSRNAVCCNHTKKMVNKEYFFELFTEALNFAAAEASCNSKGGFVASVRDTSDIEKILALMKSPNTTVPTAFLGFKKDSEGRYDNVDSIDQNIQPPIAPTMGDGGNCVILDIATNGTMQVSCANVTAYVCRYNYLDNTIVQVVNTERTWHGADEACQRIGGNLLSLYNTAQKRVVNCLISERNIVNAWTGLNDLTKELHFRWADYSISNFQPFCHNPTKDTNKDCVKMASKSHPGKSNGKDTSGHDTEYGCLKPEACGLGHPYVCQIKNPNCKPSTNRYKEYLTTLLSEAAQVNKVCGGSCKAGSKGGKGVSSYFKKERRQKKKIGEGRVPKNGNKKNGKKTKVTKKTTKGKKRKTSISTFFL